MAAAQNGKPRSIPLTNVGPIQADVEGGSGGPLVKSSQVKAVPETRLVKAFHRHWMKNTPDLGS